MSLDDTQAPATPVDSSPAPAPTPAPETAAPAAEAAAPEVSVDDELAKVWSKNNPSRDESGRFASRETPAPQAPVEGQQAPAEGEKPAETPAAPAAPVVEPPRAWTAEQRALWAKMPPEAQQLVAQRETELHEIKTASGRLMAEYQPLRQMMQHPAVQAASGGDGPGYVQFLLEAAHGFEQNPAAMIQRLAQHYAVDLGQLYDPLAPPPNTEAAQLARQNALLQGQLQAQQRQRADYEQSARSQAVHSAMEAFLSQHPDANEFVAEIAAEVHALRADNPNKDIAALLKEAYERAAWVHPQAREKRIAELRKADEAKRIAAAKEAAAKAKTAASVNVQGSASPSAGDPDLDTMLRGIYRKNNVR